MASSLVNCRKLSQPVGSATGIDGVSASRRFATSTWSPRLASKPIAVRTSAGDAFDVFLVARLVGELALVVLDVVAVDHHGDRDAVEPAAFGHLGLGCARNLVVDDFLGLAVLVARRLRAGGRLGGTLLCARQIVGDRDLAFLVVARGHDFLAGLAGANDAAFRVEPVGGLGDAVEVEIGGELDARAPGSHHRGNDGLDLIAHPLLERDLALIGAHAARRLIAIAVGQQAAGFVDDRNALRLQPVDGGRGEMADRPHLCRIEAAAHLEHD